MNEWNGVFENSYKHIFGEENPPQTVLPQMVVAWFQISVWSVKGESLEVMKRKLQLVCIIVFCLPLIVVVILINECYYLCRKDCGESVSVCVSYLRVTNSRVELYHDIIHWNQPKLITHQNSLTIACSTRGKKMKAGKVII